MNRIEHWDGQIEGTQIEYDQIQTNESLDNISEVFVNPEIPDKNYERADKTDYIVAASCGVLTGLLDSFWVGEFSLSSAQDWGRTKEQESLGLYYHLRKNCLFYQR